MGPPPPPGSSQPPDSSPHVSLPPIDESSPHASLPPIDGSAWSPGSRNPVVPHASIQPVFEITNGIASVSIPDEIYAESDPLWKSFLVGYFIGDAPHVGTIHATVNRIWAASAKVSPKIDVQFIEKNTVLFRIENAQLRSRVARRQYWHISDVPLVVNVWSPETAKSPPDLSAMPLWVDLRGVPSHLYSESGLKFLSSTAGKFVKLHPNTLQCTRLDLARVLVEVNLHNPLIENIQFRDQAGSDVNVGVTYPWLPPRCFLCHKWGHISKDCQNAPVDILKKTTEEDVHAESGSATDARNVVSDLILELQQTATVADEVQHVTTTEVTETVVHESNEGGKEFPPPIQRDGPEWTHVPCHGRSPPAKHSVEKTLSADKTSMQQGSRSPSRFLVLVGRDETGELEEGEVDSAPCEDAEECDVEEGESDSVEEWDRLVEKVKAGKKEKARTKTPRKQYLRAKDLKRIGNVAVTKKASSRKL